MPDYIDYLRENWDTLENTIEYHSREQARRNRILEDEEYQKSTKHHSVRVVSECDRIAEMLKKHEANNARVDVAECDQVCHKNQHKTQQDTIITKKDNNDRACFHIGCYAFILCCCVPPLWPVLIVIFVICACIAIQ